MDYRYRVLLIELNQSHETRTAVICVYGKMPCGKHGPYYQTETEKLVRRDKKTAVPLYLSWVSYDNTVLKVVLYVAVRMT